jgi:NADPH-dependent 2,4-dienoyl-CoA reductase/sulfur reductase-like enzyme/rhodanese-related sulfurtransferase
MARKRILIVGGVAAGASAATRARRLNESAEIIVFEKGEHVSFANCGLPYHIGGQIADRAKLLLATPDSFRKNFNIDVRTRQEVLRIDRQRKQIVVRNGVTGGEYSEPYDKLILAPGASPIVPPWGVEAANVFTLRDVADTDRIKAYVDGRGAGRAVVIGAGFIGLEMVEVLRHRGWEVEVVELQPQVLPPLDVEMAAEVADVLRRNGVELQLGVSVSALTQRDGYVTGVQLADARELPADLVLVSVGVRPNTKLASDAGLTIGPSHAIAVNDHGQTSDPDIYAAGDAAEVVHSVTGKPTKVPLAGPANRNGRLAGQHAATGEAPACPKVAGTAIVGVFGSAAAITGLSEKAAAQLGIPHAAVHAIRPHHAGYYPGAQPMILKLVYDSDSGRVLGAQAVGGSGVDKRIDVVATAIHFGGTIDDLASLDLSYAPQFGSAKDPVHIAAFIAQNQRDGLVRQLAPGAAPIGRLIDVRTQTEFAAGTLPGAEHIPLHCLRERLGELNKGEPVTVFCQVGQRGYNAARILAGHGFKEVYNLAGGYRMYRDATAQ